MVTGRDLVSAVIEGDPGRVQAMLKGGLDPDGTDELGTTPLYHAAVHGNQEMVRLLLEYGADPNRVSGGEDEGLPLCAAACWDHDECVQALLDGGADPNAAESHGWTALLWAAANGNLTSADILLDAGADPNVSNGQTPLTLAVRYGAFGVGWSLLEHGADPAEPDDDGATPLQIAREWLDVDLEAALREQVAGEDRIVVVTRSHAEDGTELVNVEARSPDGSGSEVSRQRGHAALATLLEEATGLRVPVEELVRRALPYRDVDEDGETWWAVVHVLRNRGDGETLAALAGLCESPDPIRREFAVDALGEFGFGTEARPFVERTLPILCRLAVEETEPAVLRSVLAGLAHHADPRALPEVLAVVTRHGRKATVHDAMALAAVLPSGDEDGLAALIRLTEDADPEVRDWATMGLAGLAADTDRVREALARRLADTDITTVAEAVRGLAGRGDRRAIDGIHRVLSETDDAYARDLALGAAGELGISLDGISR